MGNKANCETFYPLNSAPE